MCARTRAFCIRRWGPFHRQRPWNLFEGLGVELKVERGRRVFPVSDKAEEIRQALLRYAQDAELVHDGAKKLLLEEVTPEPEAAPAAPENPRHPKKKKAGPALRCIGVRGTSGREYRADAVLVATGGVSYPHHRLYRRRLQTGPAGRAHPHRAGAQSGQSCEP